MNSPLPGIRAASQPANLIDTIQAGFNLVNRTPWLLLIPLALDLLIWLGPQLTVGSLLEQVLSDASALVSPDQPGASATQEQTGALIKIIRQGEGQSRYNLLSLISPPPLGIPSFATTGSGRGPALPVSSFAAAVGLGVAFVALGLVLTALFHGLIGQVVREGAVSLRAFAEEFRPLVLRLIGLFGVSAAGLLLFSVPLGMVSILPEAAFPIRSLVGSVLLGVALWIIVYLFFAPEAVYVTRLGPIEAIKASWLTVRHNLWSALGIIGLIFVISYGFEVIWSGLANMLREPGVVLAICGHIYISTGLTAASMTYYKERFDRLPQTQTVPNLE